MLTNRIIFARLIALLRSTDPNTPLPERLERYLWENMEEEPIARHGRVLEERHEKHKKAYYIVRGFVIVYAFDESENKFTYRLYRKDTIVALDAFMGQTASDYMIWACPGVVLWSIGRWHMQHLCREMPGVELLAQKTASRFHVAKERLRAGFLLLPAELRVQKFYSMKGFNELLPVRSSPIQDQEIAEYVNLSLVKLRRTRKKLRGQGVL